MNLKLLLSTDKSTHINLTDIKFYSFERNFMVINFVNGKKSHFKLSTVLSVEEV